MRTRALGPAGLAALLLLLVSLLAACSGDSSDPEAKAKGGPVKGGPSNAGAAGTPSPAAGPRFTKLSAPGLAGKGGSANTVSPSTPPVLGQSFIMQLPVSGGAPPYTWEVVWGTFPPGLSLGKDGRISGIPSTVGAFNWAMVLTDSEGTEVSVRADLTTYYFDAQTGQPPPGGTPAADIPSPLRLAKLPQQVVSMRVFPPASLEAGRQLSIIPFIQGGRLPWTIRVVGLPKGLTYDKSTGWIQGQLTGTAKNEEATVDMFLTDGDGRQAETRFTMKVTGGG